MKKQGVEVHVVSSPGKQLEMVGAREIIPTHPVEMPRRISLMKDSIALYEIVCLFNKLKPTIVHAHTPKGGLLGVLGARIAQVPVVVYTIHGLPFVTARGLKRRILCWTETIACRLAHQVLAVSFHNRQRAISAKLCSENKLRILENGSCNGVDALGRFNPQSLFSESRAEFRSRYYIPPKALVLGYVGRIVRDKGIIELESTWQTLRRKFPDLYLLIIGPEEDKDPVPAEVLTRLKSDPRVRLTGGVDNPVPFYIAMDIMVLPTYREGFPVTPLEASAMQIPVVATRVDGCMEAVADGVTGILVPPGNIMALSQAIESLILQPHLRQQMGLAGRQRVLNYFRPELIWDSLYQLYVELIRHQLKTMPTK